MAPKQMAIPQPFGYLLPGQGLVAGVAIYSTIYVFGVGKIPFILAVVAAGLHFLLGVYFCFVKNRLRTHDLYLVPVVLVAGAGVWAGSLYYFAKLLEVVLRLGRIVSTGSQPETATWTKVGTSMTGLNVLLDIILLIVFIVAVSKKTSPSPHQEPVYNPPTTPAHAPTAFPVAPQPQQQYYQYAAPSTLSTIQQQQQQPPPAPQRIVSSTSSDFKTPLPVASAISPTSSPSPSQQQQYYRQYQQPQTVMYQHQRQQSFTTSQQQQQQQQTPQYQQQQFSSHAVSYSPSPQPPPTPPPPQPSQVQYGQSHNMAANTNRITTLRRLSALQSPPGNWIYTPELASLLLSQSPQQQPVIITPNTPSQNITLQTKHLMTILRDGISSAQREGGLTPAELSSLQGVNWDLGWVGLGIERAEGWLNMNNQSQGQGSWADIQYGGGPGAYGSR